MAVLATDDFNRADNTDLGANWVVVPGGTRAQLTSNAIRPSASNTDCDEYYDGGVSWPDNQYSEVTFSAIPTSGGSGPAVRRSAAANSGYFLEVRQAGLTLGRMNAGSYSAIFTTTYSTISQSSTVRLEAYGSTLSIYVNGALIATKIDATHTTGKPGVHLYHASSVTAGQIDSWSGGDAVVPPVNAKPRVGGKWRRNQS